MASNTDQEEATKCTPCGFTELVTKYEDKLPLAFQVTGGGKNSGIKATDNSSVHLHKGDIVWVEEANVDDIVVSTEKKEHTAVIPTQWTGKFQLPLKEEFPVGHVYNTVAELVKEFPIFATVREEVEIEGIIVKQGSRVQLLRQTITKSGDKVLECNVVETGDNVTLSENLDAKFEKTERDLAFEVKDVLSRLPLHVVYANGVGEESTESEGSQIEGIPNDYKHHLLLKSLSYSKAVLWETLNQDKVSLLKIPRDTKMEVVLLDGFTNERGPATDVMELAKLARKDKPIYAVPAEGNDDTMKELDIPRDAILVLYPAETVEKILIKGSTSRLIVNKQYRGHFKPQTEYGTGQDLVNYGIFREVFVTQPYNPTEPGLSCLYINDIVKLHLPSTKLFSADEDSELLVVELERTLSKTGGNLGIIYVAAHALVGFREKAQYSEDQKLSTLSHSSQVPISASFISGPLIKTPTDGVDEEILQEESPLMILGVHKYLVVTVMVRKKENSENSKIIEISDHWNLKLHRVPHPQDSPSPSSSHPIKSHRSVAKASEGYFDRLNHELQMQLATKNVNRRKKKKTSNSGEKRKTWVQRHLSLKSFQQRFSRAPTDRSTGQNVQITEEMTL